MIYRSRLVRPVFAVAFVALAFAGHVHAQLKMGDQWRLRSPSPQGPISTTFSSRPQLPLPWGWNDGDEVVDGFSWQRLDGIAGQFRRADQLGCLRCLCGVQAAGRLGELVLQVPPDAGATWQLVETDLPEFNSVIAISGASNEFMILLQTSFSPYEAKLAVSSNGTRMDGAGQR